MAGRGEGRQGRERMLAVHLTHSTRAIECSKLNAPQGRRNQPSLLQMYAKKINGDDAKKFQRAAASLFCILYFKRARLFLVSHAIFAF
jgi:hypothetical protein